MLIPAPKESVHDTNDDASLAGHPAHGVDFPLKLKMEAHRIHELVMSYDPSVDRDVQVRAS